MFDIMEYDGDRLVRLPLLKRKSILKECTTQTNKFIYSDYYENGSALFNKITELGYEGIVSKMIDSPYVAQKRHKYWYKIKVKKKILAVIGGFKVQGATIKSLLLGINKEDKLFYIGSASIGLSQHDLQLLKNSLNSLEIGYTPFYNLKPKESIIFTKPIVTCWIEFLEWTEAGGLRHPQIIGFSDLSANNANGDEITV